MRRTRQRAIAAQADALDAFAIDGIPPQHSVPVGADAAPALAGGQALDRFHRRGISRRLSSASRRRAKPARVLAAVAAAIDHVLGERKRRISGQQRGGRRSRASASASCGSASSEIAARRRRARATRLMVRFADGEQERATCSRRTGSRAIRSGRARSTAGRSGCRCGRCSTASTLSHRGVETRAYVYTEREAAAARLMPTKKVADTGKAVRCPMPGLVVSIAVARRPGGQGRRDAGRGRGHEDGKRAARRARRHREDDPGQARRQPRGRRRDHGVRVTRLCRAAGLRGWLPAYATGRRPPIAPNTKAIRNAAAQ